MWIDSCSIICRQWIDILQLEVERISPAHVSIITYLQNWPETNLDTLQYILGSALSGVSLYRISVTFRALAWIKIEAQHVILFVGVFHMQLPFPVSQHSRLEYNKYHYYQRYWLINNSDKGISFMKLSGKRKGFIGIERISMSLYSDYLGNMVFTGL